MKRGIFLLILLLAFFRIAIAQSTTTNLGITKPQVGQAQPATTIATGFDNFDSAVAGRLSKSVAGSSDVTLTTTEARNAILELTGTLTGNINVIVPNKNRKYLVYNATSGAFTLTVKTAAGTGIAVTQGARAWLYCDATNVVSVGTPGGSGATTALDNLASVAINTSLLPGTAGAIDLGSAAKPFRYIFMAGDSGTPASNNFKFTGTATAARTITFPDLTGTAALLTGAQTFSNKTLDNTNSFSGYFDATRISAPGNPSSGSLRLFANDTTGKLACLDSAGADCMPSGGGASWSALTDPSGNLSLAMAANRTAFTWGSDYGSNVAYELIGTNTSATGPLVKIRSSLSTLMSNLLISPGGDDTFEVTKDANIKIGISNPGGSATRGFPYFPVIASGAEPSGTPTSISGFGPLVLESDGVNSEYRLWGYLNSGWRNLTGSAGGGSAWSALTNPSGNLALTMGANTSTFTYNTTTGTNNLFALTTGTDDTGTNYLFSLATPGSSNAKKAFGVTSRGSLAFEITATGAPSSPGAGAGGERYGSGSVAAGASGHAFGNGASAAGTSSNAFGGSATVSTGTGGIAIGNLSQSGNLSIALGYQANASGGDRRIAIGRNAAVSHNDSLTIGADGITLAANQAVIGSATSPYTNVYFGNGPASTTPQGATLQSTPGFSNNTNGTKLSLAGGAATGNAVPGSIALQTSVVGSSGGTTQTLIDRYYVNGARKTLTDASTNLFEVALPTLKGCMGEISYEIFATDGTDVQVRRGVVQYSAVNKAGAYTSEITVVNEGVSASSGTLTATFAVTGGTNKVTISVTPSGSLTETTYYILYTLTNNSEQAITIL
jgi:hypothetical protein